MTKKIGWKILLIGITAVLLFLPQSTLFAADKSHIGDPCINDVTNADCKIGEADLDCEVSQKKDASNNYLKYCDCAAPSDCEAEYGKPANGTWECSDGSAYTYDLDYCYNTVTKLFKPALTELNKSASVPSKLIDAIFDSPATQAALLEEVKTFKPGLEIRLPGLTFSDLAKTVDEEGYLQIPWIGEFIRALYNFGLAIISIVAVVMIIMQGAKIVVSGGESKVEGYKKIGQIAIGLVIAWGSYAILYTINPALVEFKSLKIKYIDAIPLSKSYEAASAVAEDALSSVVGVIPQLSNGLFSINLKVPPASSCANTCVTTKKGQRCADQELRDMAYEAQTKTGYPAAVLLSQYMIEGPTFGLTCSGAFTPSENGDKSAIDAIGCSEKCGAGFTWECTNNNKYLPPKAARDKNNGQPINCGKGKQLNLGFVRVSGYRCFQKPVASGNKFAPLIEYYERKKCFREKKEKYGGDPIGYAKAVQSCGYATDQTYADTLINTMTKYCFTGEVAGTGEVEIKTDEVLFDNGTCDPTTQSC